MLRLQEGWLLSSLCLLLPHYHFGDMYQLGLHAAEAQMHHGADVKHGLIVHPVRHFLQCVTRWLGEMHHFLDSIPASARNPNTEQQGHKCETRWRPRPSFQHQSVRARGFERSTSSCLHALCTEMPRRLVQSSHALSVFTWPGDRVQGGLEGIERPVGL